MKTILKYSMGIGDRFGHQGKAQLSAMIEAKRHGALVAPVWNKSNREHSLIGTRPPSVRAEADAATKALGWTDAYYVDADHIGLKTVDGFIESCDFFTLDVADFAGQRAAEADIRAFAQRHSALIGSLRIPDIAEPLTVSQDRMEQVAAKYLKAVQEAGRLYRHIAERRGAAGFVTEVSMDETDEPQGPVAMLLILAAIADEQIPAQTIAPKFTGRFNKGVDYVGDLDRFEREFRQDLAVIAFAVKEFGLPATLKLSVHSGSDKFSLYPIMRRALRDANAGLHLKTAGTTWLEELAGLARAAGEGLAIARDVYRNALARYDELCAPYSTVIDINKARLPDLADVDRWDGETFAATLVHDPSCPRFNPHFRQLIHVAFKVAAEMGDRYLSAVERHENVIAPMVAHNVYERHLKPLFVDR